MLFPLEMETLRDTESSLPGLIGRRWWRTLTLHLLVSGRQLGLLLGSQNTHHLRHHLCLRHFQLNMNLRARLSRSSHRGFVEFAGHWIALAIMQSAHLIVQRLVAFTKTILNFFDLRL